MTLRTLSGRLVGRRHAPAGNADGAVLHLVGPRPSGEPAENGFVFVDLAGPAPRARYLSWVNLYDIEYAASREPGRWSLAEAEKVVAFDAEWRPFGWGETPFPSVADVVPSDPTALSGVAA